MADIFQINIYETGLLDSRNIAMATDFNSSSFHQRDQRAEGSGYFDGADISRQKAEVSSSKRDFHVNNIIATHLWDRLCHFQADKHLISRLFRMVFFNLTHMGYRNAIYEHVTDPVHTPHHIFHSGLYRTPEKVQLPPIDRREGLPEASILPMNQTAAYGPGPVGSHVEYMRQRTKHMRNPAGGFY